jgi:pilus assembly protein Flp/PilA
MQYIALLSMLFDNLVHGGDEEEGQGLVEYALILVLISVVAIVVMGTLGGKVSAVFEKIQSSINVT